MLVPVMYRRDLQDHGVVAVFPTLRGENPDSVKVYRVGVGIGEMAVWDIYSTTSTLREENVKDVSDRVLTIFPLAYRVKRIESWMIQVRK